MVAATSSGRSNRRARRRRPSAGPRRTSTSASETSGVRHEQLVGVDAAARVGVEPGAAQAGQVVGRDPERGLLLELAGRSSTKLLAVLEPAAGQSPQVGVDRRVLVTLLHQDPSVRVDDGHAREVVHAGDPSPNAARVDAVG